MVSSLATTNDQVGVHLSRLELVNKMYKIASSLLSVISFTLLEVCEVDYDRHGYRNKLDVHIKIFLSDIYSIDQSLMTAAEPRDPMWSTKGNFLSLLNLPNQIYKYGSIRTMWDRSSFR